MPTPQRKLDRDRAERVEILVRVRPPLPSEDPEEFVAMHDPSTLRVHRPGNPLLMRFDQVLTPEASQADQFALVQDLIYHCLGGVNCTIFAYGQTGAGKTFSVIGECQEPDSSSHEMVADIQGERRGILPRSLELMVTEVARRREKDAALFLSFYQVYNEKIFDLFSTSESPQPLEVRESKQEVTIPQLQRFQVETVEQAIDLLYAGLRNRVTGSTAGNKQSSRSHSIFQVSYSRRGRVKGVGEQLIESSLRIVDLAGSQKFKIPSNLSSQEREIRIQELTCINGSLSSLGHCISALVDRSRTHIPFRNSKLTRVLSDALMGNGKMRFIVCVSPSLTSAAETFSTLQFADRAKKAILDFKPQKLRTRPAESEELETLRKELEEERRTRQELEKHLKGREDYKLILQNSSLKEQVARLKQQLALYEGKKERPSLPSQAKSSSDYCLQNLSIFRDITNERNRPTSQKKEQQDSRRELGMKENKSRVTTEPSARPVALPSERKVYFQKRVKAYLEEEPSPLSPLDSESLYRAYKPELQQVRPYRMQPQEPQFERKFGEVRQGKGRELKLSNSLESFQSFDFNNHRRAEAVQMEAEIKKAVLGLKDLKERDKQIELGGRPGITPWRN